MLAQMQLSWADYLGVALYALLVLGLGAWFGRQQRTSTDYLLAGRSMGWLVVGISQLASLLSAISYLGNPGEAYAHDLTEPGISRRGRSTRGRRPWPNRSPRFGFPLSASWGPSFPAT